MEPLEKQDELKPIKGEINRTKPEKCEHYFIRISGREIKCRKCGIGYFTNIKLVDGQPVS